LLCSCVTFTCAFAGKTAPRKKARTSEKTQTQDFMQAWSTNPLSFLPQRTGYSSTIFDCVADRVQQSRISHRLGLSSRSSRANDLGCWRAWLRKTFRCAHRWKADCVRGTGKGDTPVRGDVMRPRARPDTAKPSLVFLRSRSIYGYPSQSR